MPDDLATSTEADPRTPARVPRWAALLGVVAAGGVVLAHVWVVTWLANQGSWSMFDVATWELERAGQLGDLFGGLTAFLGALSVAGLVATLYLQRLDLRAQARAISLQTEELRLARSETARQAQAMEDQAVHLAAMQESAVMQAEALREQATALVQARVQSQATMLTLHAKNAGAGWAFHVHNHGPVAINVRAWIFLPTAYGSTGRFVGPVALPNAVLPASGSHGVVVPHLPYPRLAPNTYATVVVVLAWINGSTGIQSATSLYRGRSPVGTRGNFTNQSGTLQMGFMSPRTHSEWTEGIIRERGAAALRQAGMPTEWLEHQPLERLGARRS